MNEKYFKIGFQMCRFHSLIMQILGGVYYTVLKKPNLSNEKKYIIVSNHTSYLDIIFSTRIFSNYFLFMGKKELGKVPLFNIFFKKFNVLVDRNSISASHKAFIEVGERIDKGASMVIFPEGTIPHHAPKLKPFKSGAFRLAIEKQLDIVPVVYLDSWRMLGDKSFFSNLARPGIARVVIHNPISTKGLKENDLLFLQNQTFHLIEGTLKEYKVI